MDVKGSGALKSPKSAVKGDGVNYIYTCEINGTLYSTMPELNGEGEVIKGKING